ncbi:MAG TPA: VWA domain-containing protein [Candidatus Polarisedimenticolia bacterium]|nr:VWA domain-containing protein [Candidatus Polarisedimenticolia bacterium]
MTWHWQNPHWLYLLLSVPALVAVHVWLLRKGRRSIRFPDLGILSRIPRAWTLRLRHAPFSLRMTAVALMVLALARPQAGQTEEEVLTEGIDILVVLDNSGSMAAEDFKPNNRLHVAKETVARFVKGRHSDRIGLVVFAEKSYTKCPLTLDYGVLQTLLNNVALAPRNEDGTAIGMGLATGVNRLRTSRVKSRVIVLITDGRNNRGAIDPETGAALAKALGIRIYTIGVGTKGEAPYPVDDPVFGRRYIYIPADIDEPTLEAIAEKTGGLYFRATDARSLESIFQRIDRLEKTEVKVKRYSHFTELFPLFLFPAAALFLLEVGLSQTRLRRMP